jgi:uncharacterized membrane protein
MAPESPTGGATGGGFDLSSINRNDLGVMTAGIVAFIASFLPYIGGKSVEVLPGVRVGGGHVNAWHSYAILGLLLIFVGAIVIALKTFAAQAMPATLPIGLHLLAAALTGLGTLLVILRAVTADHASVKWGGYILFIAGIAATVFAVLGMRESGEKVAWQSSGPAAPAGPPPTAPPSA